MNNIQIPQRGIYKEYAGAWDEISPKDAPYIGKCLYWLEQKEIDVDMFRKLVVDRLINRVNSANMPMQGDKAWDLWANEGQLADTVNFFFKIRSPHQTSPMGGGLKNEAPPKSSPQGEDLKNASSGSGEEQDGVASAAPRNDAETYEVIPNFVKNLVPEVKIGWFKYYGPDDFLGEMSFVEFKDLLYCADKWMKTKEVCWLDRMMAISYRRKQWFLGLKRMIPSRKFEKRVKYNPTLVDFRIKKFEKLDIGAKYMFFQYVMGCMYMMKTDAEGAGIELDGHICNLSIVFDPKHKTKKEDGEPENEDVNEPDDGIGLSGVIMALAESGVFGNIDRTAEANVWDVITRLYQLELQRREFDRK